MSGHLQSISQWFSVQKGWQRRINEPPIYMLPTELLLEIFVLCVPQIHGPSPVGLQHAQSEHTLDVNTHPWALTRVCRRWYSLATSYPILWSTIISPPHPSPSQNYLARIQLARSAHIPLSFHLDSCSLSDGQALLKALFEHCHRWKAVHLPHISDDLGFPNPSFPLLEDISCHTETFSLNFPPLEHRYFPRLRSASFYESSTQFNVPPPSNLEMTLASQVTHLTLTELEFDEALPLLWECAPFLHFLALYSPGTTNSTTMIAFPKLRHLHLHDALPNVVDTLHCPCLEELVIVGGVLGTRSFPSTSPLTLTSLEVTWSPHATVLHQFLAYSTEIVSLKVHICHSGLLPEDIYGVERFLELLSDHKVCPKLANISIHGLSPHPRMIPQVIAFIRMVRSRGSSLRQAALCAQKYGLYGGVQYRPSSALENDLFRGQLKQFVAKLRSTHPHLDLQVSYKLDRVAERKLFGVQISRGWRLIPYIEEW